MPPVSFAKRAPSQAPAPSAPAPPVATVVVVPTPTPVPGVVVDSVNTTCGVPAVAQKYEAPANPNVFGGPEDFIPEFKDIILPRLNIAQGIGDLGKIFAPGSVVFNQTTSIFTPSVIDGKTQAVTTPASPPVVIVCLGFRPTRYVEKITGGFGGMIVHTEEAVREAGGTLDYNEHKLKAKDGMKRFEQLAEALVAIQRPEAVVDDDTVFVYPVDDKKYCLALWGMKGTAFTAAAKRVFFTNRRMGCLRDGYPTRSFALATRWQSYEGGNGAHVPVLTPLAPTSQTFREWVLGVLHSPSGTAEGAAEAAE